jgi:hypothetical protein
MSAEEIARAVAALAAATGQNVSALTSSSANQNASLPQYSVPGPVTSNTSKYNQLLALIEELGKDVKPTYTGNRNCAERLKRGINHARILVKECLHEIEINNRKSNQQ